MMMFVVLLVLVFIVWFILIKCIVDSSYDEVDLGSVSGVGKVSVNLFCFMLVQVDEVVQDVVVGSGVVVIIFVVREVVFYGVDWKFFFEMIDFVEEEDDGSFDELF